MKTKHKGPNVALLRRLARKLRRLRHEKHYDQDSYFTKTQCGTAACVAGHTVLMSGYRFLREDGEITDLCVKGRGDKRGQYVWRLAGSLLGLKREVSSILFDPFPQWYWPEPFRTRWSEMVYGHSTERPSRIAADYLDHLADEAEANRKTRKRKAATT